MCLLHNLLGEQPLQRVNTSQLNDITKFKIIRQPPPPTTYRRGKGKASIYT